MWFNGTSTFIAGRTENLRIILSCCSPSCVSQSLGRGLPLHCVTKFSPFCSCCTPPFFGARFSAYIFLFWKSYFQPLCKAGCIIYFLKCHIYGIGTKKLINLLFQNQGSGESGYLMLGDIKSNLFQLRSLSPNKEGVSHFHIHLFFLCFVRFLWGILCEPCGGWSPLSLCPHLLLSLSFSTLVCLSIQLHFLKSHLVFLLPPPLTLPRLTNHHHLQEIATNN